MNVKFSSKLDKFIDEYSVDNNCSGHLRVTYRDEIIYERMIGFADIETRKVFDKNSVFSIYSMSKPFCAIGLLKLADKGAVDIDKHPSVYVPEAAGFDGRVTIRQMLHHISGIPDFIQTGRFGEKYPSGHPDEIREHLVELAKLPMVFEPGTEAMYNNTNFVISALIIENVSGIKYPEYMNKEVFGPLGMKNTCIDVPGLEVDNRVTGYVLKDDVITPVKSSIDWTMGGGDILSTVEDVYCLNKVIKNRLILKNDTWNQVLTPSLINSMGLGCTVTELFGKKCVMHNGGHRGFRSLHVQTLEDDLDIIYLSNFGWGNTRGDFNDAIFDIFYGGEDSISKISMDKGYI